MKALLFVVMVVGSVSAFATEFSAKMERVFCTIENSKLVRTQFINKAKTVSFTETKTVDIKGLDTLLPKVLETATEGPARTEEDYAFSMTHEGKSYVLNFADSDETQLLIRLIGQSCR